MTLTTEERIQHLERIVVDLLNKIERLQNGQENLNIKLDNHSQDIEAHKG